MAKWYLELEGEAADLEELPYWFPDGQITGIREGDIFLLTSASLENLAEIDAVRREGDALLEEVSSIIRLLWTAFRPPVIRRYIEEDDAGKRKSHYVLKTVSAEFRIKSRAVILKNGKREQTAAQSMRVIIEQCPNLSEALLIWADPRQSWPKLYRILEELESQLGRHVDQFDFCSSTERTRFTRSANSAHVSGRDARHAHGRAPPPANPMTWDEAKAFIQSLLYTCFKYEAAKFDLPM